MNGFLSGRLGMGARRFQAMSSVFSTHVCECPFLHLQLHLSGSTYYLASGDEMHWRLFAAKLEIAFFLYVSVLTIEMLDMLECFQKGEIERIIEIVWRRVVYMN